MTVDVVIGRGIGEMAIYYMRAYKQRNKELKRLGFKSYYEYLKSDLWIGIKQKVLAEHNRCKVCGCKAKIVHHTLYDLATLLGEDLTQLISLCKFHHREIEFGRKLKSGKRRKMSLVQTNVKLGGYHKKCRFCGRQMYTNNICASCKKKYATFLLDEQHAYLK